MGFFDWESLRPSEINSLYRRNAAVGEDILSARVEVRRGTVIATHRHEREEIIVVVQGAWRFMLRGREVVVGKNQVLSIPAGTAHSSEALEDTIAFNIVHAPAEVLLEDEDRQWRTRSEQDLWAV